MRKDPFRLHKLALAPFLESEQPVDFPALLAEAEKDRTKDFQQFLIFNGLAPLWHEAITTAGLENVINSEFVEKLRQVRLTAEANYLMQKKTLLRVHDTLNSAGIKYAVFKGAHIREFVYGNTALRPCTDIDVLVSIINPDEAIHALKNIGMEYKPEVRNISHEATLIDGPVQVDLHWHIMRPSRMRVDMTKALLVNAKINNGFMGLRDEASIFIMLAHPAFTKHVCNPYASLIRIIDLIRWIQFRPVNWEDVIELCEKAGVKTAAWATTYWINLLTEEKTLAKYLYRLAPNSFQRKYLEFWINNNLPSRLVTTNNLVRLFFSLAIQDSFGDSIKTLKSYYKLGPI